MNGSPSHAFETPPRVTTLQHMIYFDISDYAVRVVSNSGSWTEAPITAPHGFSETKHAQLDVDDAGVITASYAHTGNNSLIVAPVTGSTPGTATEYTLQHASLTGNLVPITVDPVTGRTYYVYNIGGLGTATNRYWGTIDAAGSQGTEVEIPREGLVLGKRTLNVVDGLMSLVTGTDDDGSGNGRIYVRTVVVP